LPERPSFGTVPEEAGSNKPFSPIARGSARSASNNSRDDSMSILIRRLNASDVSTAQTVTAVMANTFGEGTGATAARLAKLLRDDHFWLYGAFDDDTPVGGLSAHVIPITREDGYELFIYDIAVQPSHQRRRIGTKLMHAALAAGKESGLLSAFVPADNEDQHALDFYRALGGEAQAVTFFNFNSR
jgi:aminoglycoside 3-N-acetyltransferase I